MSDFPVLPAEYIDWVDRIVAEHGQPIGYMVGEGDPPPLVMVYADGTEIEIAAAVPEEER